MTFFLPYSCFLVPFNLSTPHLKLVKWWLNWHVKFQASHLQTTAYCLKRVQSRSLECNCAITGSLFCPRTLCSSNHSDQMFTARRGGTEGVFQFLLTVPVLSSHCLCQRRTYHSSALLFIVKRWCLFLRTYDLRMK